LPASGYGEDGDDPSARRHLLRLAEVMDEGRCGLPADDLAALTEKLIEVPPALIEAALALELEPARR
jgi:hypothetical protein